MEEIDMSVCGFVVISWVERGSSQFNLVVRCTLSLLVLITSGDGGAAAVVVVVVAVVVSAWVLALRSWARTALRFVSNVWYLLRINVSRLRKFETACGVLCSIEERKPMSWTHGEKKNKEDIKKHHHPNGKCLYPLSILQPTWWITSPGSKDIWLFLVVSTWFCDKKQDKERLDVLTNPMSNGWPVAWSSFFWRCQE